jgi:hypothetical protein
MATGMKSYSKTEEQFPEGLWKWSVSVGAW